MITVTNCHNKYEFTSIREACQYLGFSVNTLYNKGLPCNYGGFLWDKIDPESKRHIVCNSFGLLKWDTEFYKSSKQSEDPKKPKRVNQPCKKCTKSKNKKKKKSFNWIY